LLFFIVFARALARSNLVKLTLFFWIASSMTRNDDEKDYFVTDREFDCFSLSSLLGLLPEAI